MVLTIISNDSFSSYSIIEEIRTDSKDDSNLKSPNKSGYWPSISFIHIDRNWSITAKTKPWCSGNGSWGNPYLLENIVIDASSSPTGSGIFINNSKSEYFIIRNCTIYNAPVISLYDAGIRLENTNNGTLIANNCSNNGASGIILHNNCNNNTISENIAYMNSWGIYLWDDCDNNTVIKNTVNNNIQFGIVLNNICNDNKITGNIASNNGTKNQYSGIYTLNVCNNNTISNNYAYNNTHYGIHLSSGSVDCIILNNKVINNGYSGIHLPGNCEKNNISGNHIINNTGEGIKIEVGSHDNLIYSNQFIGNGKHAKDDGTDNQWDNGALGNYWDNYTGIDPNDDGIGDKPYIYIYGTAASQDNYPIWWDPPSFIINSPINYIEYYNAPIFNIEIKEGVAHSIWYIIDGGATKIFFTSNSSMNQTLWNALEDGYITITFYINDSKNLIDKKSVTFIKATPQQVADVEGLIDTLLILSIIIAVLVAIIGIALVFILRNSKKISRLNQLILAEKSKNTSTQKAKKPEKKS